MKEERVTIYLAPR